MLLYTLLRSKYCGDRGNLPGYGTVGIKANKIAMKFFDIYYITAVCRAPYISRSELEIFPTSWKHKYSGKKRGLET